MSEITIKGLVAGMRQKGYDQLFMFYSPTFDFYDRLDAGLKRVQEAFKGHLGERLFSMSFYPVWEESGKPYVTAYLRCHDNGHNFGLKSLNLTYMNGAVTGEIESRYIDNLTLADIPEYSTLKSRLIELTQKTTIPTTKKSRLRL